MAKSLKNCKTMLVSSTKGGVGKTIFTVNMAGIFSTLEKRVLILDLDLTSGGVGLALNKSYTKSIYNVIEDLKTNSFDSLRDYAIKYNKYISCIPCPKDPRQASQIDIHYLEIVLKQATYEYDVVLIDSNHVLTPLNLFLMDKVDQIMFLTTNDPMNLKSMRSLLAILNNMDIKNYKVLLNDSTNPYKDYFSLYDIKNIIQANIDYTLTNSFYIENIDTIIMNGQIITIDFDIARTLNKDYATMMQIAVDLTKGSDDNGKK